MSARAFLNVSVIAWLNMDEFTIREATREDKADVLAIQRFVYDGHDYLPEFYDYLLSLENARSFVLLHKDKIVS